MLTIDIVLYIFNIYLSLNWKFVPFDHLHSILPLSIPCLCLPPVSSINISSWVCFKIRHTSDHTQSWTRLKWLSSSSSSRPYAIFFLWLISLRIMPSTSIHVVAVGRVSFLSYGWMIYCYTHILSHTHTPMHTLLYPFIHWRTLRLSSYLGQCEHECADFSLVYSFPLDISPEVNFWIICCCCCC